MVPVLGPERSPQTKDTGVMDDVKKEESMQVLMIKFCVLSVVNSTLSPNLSHQKV